MFCVCDSLRRERCEADVDVVPNSQLKLFLRGKGDRISSSGDCDSDLAGLQPHQHTTLLQSGGSSIGTVITLSSQCSTWSLAARTTPSPSRGSRERESERGSVGAQSEERGRYVYANASASAEKLTSRT